MTQPINTEVLKQGRKIVNDFVGQEIPKMRETSVNYNTIQNSDETSDRVNNHRRAQTRGSNGGNVPIATSKSPDKYTINNNLVVNLNDSNIAKPVKRENSNTTNATHITGVTASTAPSNPSNANQVVKQSAFYQTQYKTGQKGGFFPQNPDLQAQIKGITEKQKLRQFQQQQQ